jgi:hypothetical protein
MQFQDEQENNQNLQNISQISIENNRNIFLNNDSFF